MNIKKISQITGLTSHTLRYYEKIGLLLNIERDQKGHRDYIKKDVVWIELIKRLKATNMPLNKIKKFADLRSKGDSTINERLKILRNHQISIQEQMDTLQSHQEKIKEKIKLCKKGGEFKSPQKYS